MVITVTELRRHLGKYLALSQTKDIYITKHGVIIAKLTKALKTEEEYGKILLSKGSYALD